jgi:nitroimidazol reductase NimA-like FMN-containing flavoprotein (pyridoxamine 5'-phosphate oxidase superfamily)
MTELFTPTEQTRVRRVPQRARYDRQTVYDILDTGLVCYVAFVLEGQPFVIPTSYARVDDQLYIHGSVMSRMVRSLSAGNPLSLNVSLIDGLVLARSAYHHSVNYRSVVVVGTAVEVTDTTEKIAALRALLEHATPGRWPQVRPPNERELRATAVLRIGIEDASAKVRSGPPIDDAGDYALPCWAGEIPLRLEAGAPVADPKLAPGVSPPDHPRRPYG